MSKLFVFLLLAAAAVCTYAEQICEPGSAFKQDCNTCRCSAAGDQIACTRKICPPSSRKKRDSCIPGTSWRQDCNTCTCSENRVARCTLRACLPRAIRQLPSSLPAETCEPGSTFKKDCNTCRCSEDGKTSVCTLKFCLPQSRRRRDVQKCQPGTTYQKDCNTCRCSEDGQTEACTLKLCLPNADMWNETCKPGSSWEYDCNTCFCTSDGHVACTKMLCVHENNAEGRFSSPAVRDKEGHVGYRCKPGTQFTEGCKTCWCSSDGLSANCEPDTCPPEVSRQKRGIEYALRCDPGEVFKRDCNTCICSVDGIADHASCTIHQCRRHKRHVTGISKSRANDSRRCKPGSFYKKDCNMCRCSEDGKTEVCTLKACQRDILALPHVRRGDE